MRRSSRRAIRGGRGGASPRSPPSGCWGGRAAPRVAVEIALPRAAERATMSCLASDAYFPFADAIQLAAERGVTAIIQPGGSRRDEMALEVADRHHMAMVFTGRRHFRH